MTKGERTRQAILDAAAEVIVERGWGRASARAVAERAGVRVGVLHYYFDSQEELLCEAGLHRMRPMVSAFAAMAASDPAGVLLAVSESIAADEPLMTLSVELYLAAMRDAKIGAQVGTLARDVRDALTQALREHGVPEELAIARAAIIVAALDGIVVHRSIDPSFPATAAAEQLRALIPPIHHSQEES